MENDQLFDEWPRVSFEDLENIEVEGKTLKVFYKSFFSVLRFPENTLNAFITLLKETPK